MQGNSRNRREVQLSDLKAFTTKQERHNMEFTKFFASAEDKDKYFDGKMPRKLNKGDCQEYIRKHLAANKSNFKGKTIKIAYYTNEGTVNHDMNISVTGDLTDAMIDVLTRDPKINTKIQSGEYLETLADKNLYGFAVFSFKTPRQLQKKVTKKKGVFDDIYAELN